MKARAVQVVRVVCSSCVVSLLETFTSQVDNIVLPIYYYALLALVL